MIPCNLCSPADKDGIPQPFDAEGNMLKKRQDRLFAR